MEARGRPAVPPRGAARIGGSLSAAVDGPDRSLGDQHHQELFPRAGRRIGPARAWSGTWPTSARICRSRTAPRGRPSTTAASTRSSTTATFIPRDVYETVRRQAGEALPATAEGFYRRYVNLTYLQPYLAIPVFLAVFVMLLYLLGKFIALGFGDFCGSIVERIFSRVPGVRAVYSAVKQVTDFVFTERELKVTRIVAVEFPRKGVWSVGFVTGESFAVIRDVAAETVLTVLLPYSPLPVTGCTIMVRKSECIDLNITFEQACQFIVSCGVVVPPSNSLAVGRRCGRARC